MRHLEGIGEQALVFGVLVPLGSESRAAPATKRAEALGRESTLRQEAAELEARAVLFDLYETVRHTVSTVEVFDTEILPRAREIRNEIERGYSVGRFSHTALVNAQAELLAAASARLDACADHHRLLVSIERLTGGEPVTIVIDTRGVAMKFDSLPHFRFLVAPLAALILVAGCDAPQSSHGDHGHAAAGEEDFERGPHNGRMLRDGDFALEITIFETGVPPEFRVYPYRDGMPSTRTAWTWPSNSGASAAASIASNSSRRATCCAAMASCWSRIPSMSW